jgi:hypothetical protein
LKTVVLAFIIDLSTSTIVCNQYDVSRFFFSIVSATPLVLVSLLLGGLNSAINPWIYMMFNGCRLTCCSSYLVSAAVPLSGHHGRYDFDSGKTTKSSIELDVVVRTNL